MQKYGGLQGRLDAAARNMAQARGLQKQMNQRNSAQVSNQDAGRGQMPASNSAPKSVGISAANQGSIDPAGAAGKGRDSGIPHSLEVSIVRCRRRRLP